MLQDKVGRRRKLRWLNFALAAVCAASLAPRDAAAIKPQPALTMTAAFDNPQPQLRQGEILRVKLNTTRDYTNLAVKVVLPPEVALVSGPAAWQGALAAGEEREMQLVVSLLQAGRYAINVDAAFDPAESPFTAARISLNVIADARGVAASMEPFTVMDLRRARTASDMESILGEDGEEAEPDPATPIPEPEPAKESLQPRATTVRVSGILKYKDSAGGVHPIRFAKIEVLNVKNGANTVIGAGGTDARGAYSIRAASAVNAPDIRVRVYTEIINGLIARVGPNASSVYYLQSTVYSNQTASSLRVDVTTSKPVVGSATDSDSARRFSVLDAVLQAAINAYALRGNRYMPTIPIIFPVGGTASFYSPRAMTISILRTDALDWDVIAHEYGHFLADKGASSQFDTSLGGAHDGGSTIPVHGKEKGVRLAWSEGFATWYAIMSQIQPTQNLLALPSVPKAGDRFWDDTEDARIHDDLETPAQNEGYAAEESLQGLLYDMCDSHVDRSADGLSLDNINVTPKIIWNILNSGNWDDVGKFYNTVCGLLGYDIPALFQISQLFAMNNVGPELKAPAEGYIVSSAISPEFSWLANGDPTAGYQHNRFTLVIANRNFTQLLAIKDNIQTTKFKFDSDVWQAIVEQSDDTGIFQWAVLGHNTVAPRIPGADGLGNFLSNMQNIQVRAYHIRLRWSKNGTDVDLHFRPPSGASYSGWRYSGDCAYYNRNPDWGIPGDARDNPHLDRDCISSGTEENITLDRVSTPGTYKVLVHYYSDHGDGATAAMVEIFRYGRLILADHTTLSETGDVWVPFIVNVRGDGDLRFEPAPGQVMRGDPEDDGDDDPFFWKPEAGEIETD